MSLPRYSASVPLGTLPYACLEVSHPAWAAALRRVIQPEPVTVTIDGTPTVFAGWDGEGTWISDYPSTDDTGRARRTVQVDDIDNALLLQIEAVTESEDPVSVRLWLFLSTDTATPVLAERYTMQSCAPNDDGTLTLQCVSRDLSVLADPFIRHTRSNAPGLRGR